MAATRAIPAIRFSMVGRFREAGSVERRVTNVWSVVQPESSGKYESLAILDCTAAPGSFRATATSPEEWLVQVPGYTLGPPPASFKVYDGMIKEMHVRQSPGGPVELVVQLEHPVEARVTVREGVPARLQVHFSWGAVHEVMTGRTNSSTPDMAERIVAPAGRSIFGRRT
jgi:hypothetical protein